jgi:hypothetical protein
MEARGRKRHYAGVDSNRPTGERSNVDVSIPVHNLVDEIPADLFAVGKREARDRLVVGIAKFDEGSPHRTGINVYPQPISPEREQGSLQPASHMIPSSN